MCDNDNDTRLWETALFYAEVECLSNNEKFGHPLPARGYQLIPGGKRYTTVHLIQGLADFKITLFNMLALIQSPSSSIEGEQQAGKSCPFVHEVLQKSDSCALAEVQPKVFIKLCMRLVRPSGLMHPTGLPFCAATKTELL